MPARGTTITWSARLVVEECCNCGILFAMPEDFHDDRRRHPGYGGKSFYCPNGHSQYYTGKTEAQKQREKATRLQAALDREEAAHKHTQNRLTATKGVVTKTKRRISKGVCPCCNRHFANVERHMTTQHPDYQETT